MNRNARIFCFLVLTLAALAGCSSQPATESKKAGTAPDRIQGKAKVIEEASGATDAALNAGGPSVYIKEGDHRYRLFLRTAVEVVDGKEYVAEGVYAQKAIDDIGDPDQGKNGYPLQSSCEHVVRMAWSDLSFRCIRCGCLAFVRQGETVSRQALVPGYADTARYSCGRAPLPRNRRKTPRRGEGRPRSLLLRRISNAPF